MKKPIIWTIAGSDSGGGAGLQADLKTINALGGHGCSLVTAITAQNSMTVKGTHGIPKDVIDLQWKTLMEDMPPNAIKIGMLGDASIAEHLADHLLDLEVFKVLDPVMLASTGAKLMDEQTRQVTIYQLLHSIDLITPNLAEASAILDRPVRTPADMEQAAEDLLKYGARSVLMKGGHAEHEDGSVPSVSADFWSNGTQRGWLTSPRLEAPHDHGTGCTLSTAIATCRAFEYHDLDAVVVGKAYLNHGLRAGYSTGSGSGTLSHEGWPDEPGDLPWLTSSFEEAIDRPEFPDCGAEPLGLYPIVDRVSWLEKLLPLGIRTLQLRIKDLEGEELEDEIRRGIEYAKPFDGRLFINDQWETALKYGAYGVHIGQDDLEYADLAALAKAGLRLGISTHSYTEISRAVACRPSYIALGTLFETTSKVMNYPALGLEAFREMRRLVQIPVVAIGGLALGCAPEVLEAGADGLAVISDIKDAQDLQAHVRNWQQLLSQRASSAS